MTVRTLLTAAGAVLSLALSAGLATAQDAPAPAARSSVLDKAVNDVRVSGWIIYGPGQTTTLVESTVQGGFAQRIDLPRAGANPWDVGAAAVTTKPIQSGDVLAVAVWIRTERPPAGSDTGRITLRLQGNAEPYPEIATETLEPGSDWKLYFTQATATRDYAPGEAAVNIQLAAAAQAIELGPIFILDMGPDFDRSTLPTN